MTTLVSTDTRGRASLGVPNRDFVLSTHSDGTIVLEPAVVISEMERRYLSNIDLQAQIEYARAHPEQRIKRQRRRTGESE